MRICSGASRRVVLIGDIAIKFARFNFIRPFLHVYWVLSRPGFMQRKLDTIYKRKTVLHSIGAYALQQLLGGIWANRQEYRLSQTHPELPIARVRALYLGGYILVMDRGEPVREEVTFVLRARYAGGDLDQAKHICSFGSLLKYVDYGHHEAPRIFGIS